MKKMLIIFFVGICDISCSQIVQVTSLKGHISEPTENIIQLGDKTSELSMNGDFQFNLEIDKPTFFDFQYDNQVLKVYIEPKGGFRYFI